MSRSMKTVLLFGMFMSLLGISVSLSEILKKSFSVSLGDYWPFYLLIASVVSLVFLSMMLGISPSAYIRKKFGM